MQRDKAARRHAATLLILRSQAGFAAAAVLAKFIGQTLSPPVIAGWILLLGPLFALFYCGYRGELRHLRRVSWRWAAVRGCLVAMALVCSYYGFKHLELATAIALSFLTPIFVTLLALLVLRERVGWYRRGALIGALIGIICIARPAAPDAMPWQGQLAMILSAACLAVSLVIGKRQLRQEQASATFFGTALCSALVALPLFGVELAHTLPDARMASALLLMATLSSFAVICDAEAHRDAGAMYLAPFTYLQLLWVTVAGLLLWGEWPATLTWFGIAMIVVSGLYTTHRERKLGIG